MGTHGQSRKISSTSNSFQSPVGPPCVIPTAEYRTRLQSVVKVVRASSLPFHSCRRLYWYHQPNQQPISVRTRSELGHQTHHTESKREVGRAEGGIDRYLLQSNSDDCLDKRFVPADGEDERAARGALVR